MPRQMDQMTRRFGAAWRAFTPAQRVIGTLVLVGLLLGGVAFARWVTAPTYAPLFSGLAGSDASAIVDKLTADGVPYQLADNGQSVLVPKDLVYAERVKLSGAGLPAAKDSGYSLMDQQGVTSSQFQQQVTFQRAMEGELAKTIMAIDGVRTSVVHLAIPQRDVFLDEAQKPSASVLVDLRPGQELGRDQVQSILHLVASSIQGMTPDHVTLADSTGRLLSASGDSTSAASDDRDQQTSEYEKRQAAALQSVLDRVVGPGHAVARVTASLNFDAINTTTEKLTSDPKTAPLAQTTTTEKYEGNGTGAAGGILGPDNIAVPNGASGANTYNKETVTTNNTISKVTEKKVAAPGAVLKQSVAVVVDSAVKNVQPAQLQQMITTAAGIDTVRGDTVSVTSMSFDTATAAAATKELAAARAGEERDQLFAYIKQGAIALVLLVVALLAWVTRRKRAKNGASQELIELERVEARSQALGAIASQRRDGLGEGAALAALGAGANSSMAQWANPGRRREDIADLVERQPDEVAELLRGWLADRRA